MRYFKICSGKYIMSIGCGLGGTEISKKEYDTIKDMLNKKPFLSDKNGYRLTKDLIWESYIRETENVDEYDTDEIQAKAYRVLMGIEV